MSTTRMHEIPTIDCELVTVKVSGQTEEHALNTASKIQVDIQTETQDAVKLIIKGVLKAQKKKKVTVTGNQITLTDNVFTPELVQLLQGGTITTDPITGAVTGYTPPVAGSDVSLPVFELSAYSARYNAAGLIIGYEKITYPNCQGNPISMTSEDNVFRVNEYVIDSAPDQGEAPYTIQYVDALPDVIDVGYSSVTQTLTNVTSSFTGNQTRNGQSFTCTLTAASGMTLSSVAVTMGGTDISASAVNNGVVTISEVTGAIVITASATE